MTKECPNPNPQWEYGVAVGGGNAPGSSPRLRETWAHYPDPLPYGPGAYWGLGLGYSLVIGPWSLVIEPWFLTEERSLTCREEWCIPGWQRLAAPWDEAFARFAARPN